MQPAESDSQSTPASAPLEPGQTSPAPPALFEQLIAMASGAWVTQMIHVAAELGLADQLAAGERDCAELASACGVDADSLFRLLRGLASLGIFQETGPRQFALTALADLLRSDHPQSLRQFARLLGGEHYLSWADLMHSVRTGENAFAHRYAQPIFAWYQQNPARAEIFDRAMGDNSRLQTEAMLEAYDFTVDAFATSMAFLEAALPDGPHCVVLDLRLPDLNGIEVLERLTADRKSTRLNSSHSSVSRMPSSA